MHNLDYQDVVRDLLATLSPVNNPADWFHENLVSSYNDTIEIWETLDPYLLLDSDSQHAPELVDVTAAPIGSPLRLE